MHVVDPREAAEAERGEQGLPSILVGYRDGVTILDLVGEHDLTTAPKIAFNIAEQIARGRGVVVSMTETEFIDSSVVGELFRGDRLMLAQGRRLVLHTRGNDAVLRVFDLARAHDRLLCCDSLEEAIEFASQRCA